MTSLKQHLNHDASLMSIFTSRFSRHPERYIEIFGVLRKYELHHIIARFMLSHRHEEDDDDAVLLADHHDHHDHHNDDDHAKGLASALEELGPCFIKLGQLLSTRPDLLPADYIHALARLQDTIQPVPASRIVQIIQAELQAPIEALFRSFDQQPLAT